MDRLGSALQTHLQGLDGAALTVVTKERDHAALLSTCHELQPSNSLARDKTQPFAATAPGRVPCRAFCSVGAGTLADRDHEDVEGKAGESCGRLSAVGQRNWTPCWPPDIRNSTFRADAAAVRGTHGPPSPCRRRLRVSGSLVDFDANGSHILMYGAVSVKRAGAVVLALVLAAAAWLATFLSIAQEQSGNGRLALVIEIDGAIGPATARHVKDGLATATERNVEIVILRLNTPGGLVTSMREIIADILASSVPVVGYVAPSGAHAASAGTYILYATHVAAMAPGTNLGAATPVELGAPFPGLPPPPDDNKDGKDGDRTATPPPKDTMSAKATNDAAAFIRSLAELRGRNADWAEKAVREAASLSADAALKERVVDLVARDTPELLERIDGRVVQGADGQKRPLATKDLRVETLEPGWLIRVLSVITDPNVAVILMLIGIYGLVFEFSTPGAIAPGVVGLICLLLGLYALDLLPIDYTGLALMLLGIVFLIVEAFNPTVVLGLGGLVAFLLGASMLLRVEAPGYQLSWTVMGIAAAMIFGLTLLVGRYLWQARRIPARVGAQAMRGLPVEVLDWSGDAGHVAAQGERWQARGGDDFVPGETVRVTAVDGLTLMVRRANGDK